MNSPPLDPDRLLRTVHAARQHLLEQRCAQGHWEGELSASALSTAVAITAFHAYRQHATPGEKNLSPLIENGLQWLAKTQNDDGGWGDTTKSTSNISTTALCWAAFGYCQADTRFPDVVAANQQWLVQSATSLEPTTLSRRIADRYGKDRTFSVPILTTLAIAGRLGPEQQAWRLVPQLPFELAALPHRWFHRLQLPVVSYALPALIAIGQVRHHRRPTRNPLARAIRHGTRRRTLRVLKSVQPASGGFLEATPLTSFVLLSLCLAGNADHDVARQAVAFLVESVREDGSWPIDTNLATWVTTLSVNGLSIHAEENSSVDSSESHLAAGASGSSEGASPLWNNDARATVLEWLLGQQYGERHPYTHAPPGAWAWTDLSGGVPDADDTPGALLALRRLRDVDGERSQQRCRQAAEHGVRWLLDLQNRDGGIPTFCRGWGHLPFDRSSPDLTAHTIRAWLAWRDELPSAMQQRIDRAIPQTLAFLARQQRPDGAWCPLWFGNQFSPTEENPTYGTTRVLIALVAAADRFDLVKAGIHVGAAVDWISNTQNADGGWGGDRRTPSTIEETAYAIDALTWLLSRQDERSLVAPEQLDRTLLLAAVRYGAQWLCEHTAEGTQFPAAPIGFYFAKLWYFEKLYPVVSAVAALSGAVRVLDTGEEDLAAEQRVDARASPDAGASLDAGASP